MTRQEAVNKAAEFLRKQGRRSAKLSEDIIPTWTCLYSGPDGTACAIGCLMSPADRASVPEGPLRPAHLVAAGLDPEADTTFARDLQGCHDYASGDFVPEFNESLGRTCKKYNLTYPEPVA